MNKILVVLVALAALSFTGCHHHKSHHKSHKETVTVVPTRSMRQTPPRYAQPVGRTVVAPAPKKRK